MPLGLYLHIPFCRKRCHFCYFRVYTDKNAQQVEQYLDLLAREWDLLREQPALAGRPDRLRLFRRRHAVVSLDAAARRRSSTRLTAHTPWTVGRGNHVRVRAGHADRSQARRHPAARRHAAQPGRRELRRRILELNGRAHRSPEIAPGVRATRARIGFPQINIDLIAGMLGETDENWRRCIERTLELEPDSVTIYQMELPYNTTITRRHPARAPGQFNEHVASLGHAAALGRRGVRGARARRLHDRQRLHGGQGSGADEVRLSRSAVAGRGSRGARRGVVRPRQRRARAEPRHLGDLRRGDRPRRAAARPRATGRPPTSG